MIIHLNSDAEGTRTISEFFVLKKYAGKEIGKIAAVTVFDLFPGKWNIHQAANNYPAQAFWRKLIYRYTNGAIARILEIEGGSRSIGSLIKPINLWIEHD